MKRLAILFIALFFPLAAMANSTVNLPSGGYTPLPGGLGAYVANFYTAALMFGGVLAFAVLMFAAAEYTLSGGNPSKQSDARDRIEQALLGLLLLLGAFIVLNAINPELVDIRLNQLREIKSVDPGLLSRTPGLVGGPCRATSPPCNTGLTCSSGGVCIDPSGPPGATCTIPGAGPCSPEGIKLVADCFRDETALRTAAGVCNKESSNGYYLESTVDKCMGPNGVRQSVSFGIFQVNISANTIGGLNCPAAFDRPLTGSDQTCKIVNMDLYNQCRAVALDPEKNIRKACELSKNGTRWNLWGPATRIACGVNN